jgi:alpha-L-rhamnosidase
MQNHGFPLETKEDWHARWIWGRNEAGGNQWMCFRKSFFLEHVPTIMNAFVSVDSRYWLWVNGKLSVFEGGLNRGPKPGACYYDTIDLVDQLLPGTNCLSILVWYWGNQGRNSVDSGAGGLLFQAESDLIRIESDQSWKVTAHPAYISTTEPYPSYLYAGHNIGFDARAEIPGWNLRDYDDSWWETATEKGTPPCAPWGEPHMRPIPLIKDFGVREYTRIEAADSDNKRICTACLPYAAHITPVFRIRAQNAGLKLDIRTDRYQVNGGPGDEYNIYHSHRTEYTTKEGVQEFESLDWLFGEKVIYTFPKDIDVLDLRYRETGFDVDFSGNFQCSDPFLNRLFEKCRRTLYVCMRDNYMDCPDRERGQWIGDVSSQVPQTFYALGRNADKLTRKAIRDFIAWKKDKVLWGNVPGSHCAELPSQSLNAVSENGMIQSYYEHTGDRQVLLEVYDAVKEYLGLWQIDEEGILIPRHGDYYWFDHGSKIDNPVLEHAWYYSALKSARKVAELTGNAGDIAWFQQRMDILYSSFHRQFWRGEGFRSESFYDDRANAMAVISGLAVKETWSKIISILKHVRNATPYMEGYVLEAMFLMGYPDEALQRMRERYASFVNHADTTLWEDFSILGTRNHAWSGGPLTVLAKYVAGIHPVTAGYGVYRVMPQMCDLQAISMTIPSVKGEIRTTMTKDTETFHLQLISPARTTALIAIPKTLHDGNEVLRIMAGHTAVWEDGNFAGNAIGVYYSGEDDRYIIFTVDAGIWSFTALYQG